MKGTAVNGDAICAALINLIYSFFSCVFSPYWQRLTCGRGCVCVCVCWWSNSTIKTIHRSASDVNWTENWEKGMRHPKVTLRTVQWQPALKSKRHVHKVPVSPPDPDLNPTGHDNTMQFAMQTTTPKCPREEEETPSPQVKRQTF